MRCVRSFLGDVRGLCLTPAALPGSRSRCLSAVRGSVAASDEAHHRNGSGTNSSSVVATGLGVVASGLGLAWYLRGRESEGSKEHERVLQVPLLQLRASDGARKEEKPPAKVSVRERRYKDFSSIKFKGQPYMTPRDFLESVTIDEPRRELELSKTPSLFTLTLYATLSFSILEIDPQFLNENEIQRLLKSTIPRSKGSKRTFREMWNGGKENKTHESRCTDLLSAIQAS